MVRVIGATRTVSITGIAPLRLSISTGRPFVVTLWDAASEVVSNILAYPEVRAALASAWRGRRIDDGQLDDAEDEWESYWSSVRHVDLTELIARFASQECRNHELSGGFGNCQSAGKVNAIIMVTWDKRLSTDAQAAGLPSRRDACVP